MNVINLSKNIGMGLVGLGLIAASSVSIAATETEINDSFATANFANAGLNSGVIGDLSAVSNDVDIWKFDLTAGGLMSATISDGPATDFNGFDPVMVLFMEDGSQYRPVAANNPLALGTNFFFSAWQTGTYYLTVSAFGNSPQDFLGNNQYDSFWLTDEFVTGTSFAGFEGQSFSSFDYNLSLVGITDITPVPVPAAAWLFATGLVGLVGVARRRKA